MDTGFRASNVGISNVYLRKAYGNRPQNHGLPEQEFHRLLLRSSDPELTCSIPLPRDRLLLLTEDPAGVKN